MSKELQKAPQGFDLGVWLGRREAYGSIAEACSAAEIGCLREMREQRLYASHARNWEEFCLNHLRTPRRTVDLNIAHLEEFGDQFFDLAKLTRISPDTFRAIRQHVSDEGIEVDGKVVALIPEKAAEVNAAVKELRKRVKTPPFEAAMKQCESTVTALGKLPFSLEVDQKLALAEVIARIRQQAASVGVQVF
ncbi:MAG TPA: hypothetical protein VGF59_08350 [Bryobacteraceae bacterium]|jgi:hypothetical protein